MLNSTFQIENNRSILILPAIPYPHIRESIGFGFGGLGGGIILVSIFEIIGLSILLYLSSE